MFLTYGGDEELVVTSYTDASWDTDPDDSKLQSGYVFILNGAAVRWRSAKQSVVAKSSTESEYIAASEAAQEDIWMKEFIIELCVVPSALDPLVIYCDNTGAITQEDEAYEAAFSFYWRECIRWGHKDLQSTHRYECGRSVD